jgi:hypothetical protein
MDKNTSANNNTDSNNNEAKEWSEAQSAFLQEQMVAAISACQKARAEDKDSIDIMVLSTPGLDLEKENKQTDLAQELLVRCGRNGIEADLEFNHANVFDKAVQFFKLSMHWDKNKAMWGLPNAV